MRTSKPESLPRRQQAMDEVLNAAGAVTSESSAPMITVRRSEFEMLIGDNVAYEACGPTTYALNMLDSVADELLLLVDLTSDPTYQLNRNFASTLMNIAYRMQAVERIVRREVSKEREEHEGAMRYLESELAKAGVESFAFAAKEGKARS